MALCAPNADALSPRRGKRQRCHTLSEDAEEGTYCCGGTPTGSRYLGQVPTGEQVFPMPPASTYDGIDSGCVADERPARELGLDE